LFDLSFIVQLQSDIIVLLKKHWILIYVCFNYFVAKYVACEVIQHYVWWH